MAEPFWGKGEKSLVLSASGGEAVRSPWPELWLHVPGGMVPVLLPAVSAQREGACVVLSVIPKPQAGFFWFIGRAGFESA